METICSHFLLVEPEVQRWSLWMRQKRVRVGNCIFFLVHVCVVRGDLLMDFLELCYEDNGADHGSNLSCRYKRKRRG